MYFIKKKLISNNSILFVSFYKNCIKKIIIAFNSKVTDFNCTKVKCIVFYCIK